MSCERAIEVEDLVLGLIHGAGAEALESHVEACVDCKDAREMFLAERALFTARPVPVAPPALVLPRPAALRVYRFVPAIAAVAAGLALFIGRPHGDDCNEPAPAAITSTTASSDELGTGVCRAPESPAPAVSLASHDPNACVPSPNATCDVTSSTATP